MIGRITSDNITELQEGEVFIFGSNLSGIHGGGAAKIAHVKWGAVWGNPWGLQGKTFAIPTKDYGIIRTLSINEIKPFVDKFIEFAKGRPDLTFLVTEIGCGLAGLKYSDVGPLFREARDIDNIHLPQNFWNHILE
jgi:hypothetical protein